MPSLSDTFYGVSIFRLLVVRLAKLQWDLKAVLPVHALLLCAFWKTNTAKIQKQERGILAPIHFKMQGDRFGPLTRWTEP
jgi:hypothetical protein